jgi:hypothetical protein
MQHKYMNINQNFGYQSVVSLINLVNFNKLIYNMNKYYIYKIAMWKQLQILHPIPITNSKEKLPLNCIRDY